ncbi:MAG: peptidylprolyl isomerase [Flavobacteriales bacterium]|nr:peptidylprolyl isomerase [Flavobacteriales bacterium]
MKYFAGMLPLWLLIFGCGNGKSEHAHTDSPYNDTMLVRIHTLSDQRNTDALAAILSNSNAEYVVHSLQCLSAFGDKIPVDAVAEMLMHADPGVRTNAAYVLGQIQQDDARLALSNALRKPDADEVVAQIIESLGKQVPVSGNAAFTEIQRKGIAQEVISAFVQHPVDSELLRSAFGRATAHIHRVYSGDDRLLQMIPYHLQHAMGTDRFQLANAMARFTGTWGEKEIKYVKSWVKTEKSAQVRAAIMTMLGRIKDTESAQLLQTYASNRTIPAVIRISALRALMGQSLADVDFFTALLEEPDDRILGEMLELLGTGNLQIPVDALDKLTTHQSSFIASLACGLALPQQPAWIDRISAAIGKAGSEFEKAQFIRAAGRLNDFNQLSSFLAPFFADTHPVLNSAAADALVRYAQSAQQPHDYNALIREAFAKGDPGSMAVLAALIGNTNIHQNPEVKDFAFVREAMQKLQLPRDIETYNELNQALNRAEGTSQPNKTVAFNHPVDWEHVRSLGAHPQVKITTPKGSFTIDLDPLMSPGSVSEFCTLVASGHFDNKPFHRVVNNFVIQTGCTRGDGWGSMDYTLRSEFGLHDYRAGAVGLASAGTDTESCQWFVTHLPTPHLEGRYTIIGYVNQGMNVVELTTIGDPVLKAELIVGSQH